MKKDKERDVIQDDMSMNQLMVITKTDIDYLRSGHEYGYAMEFINGIVQSIATLFLYYRNNPEVYEVLTIWNREIEKYKEKLEHTKKKE